jgi:hypothetical protein
MDARLAKIMRLHWLDLHAQMHALRGQERGHLLWMIRGARIEMIAKARLEKLVLGRQSYGVVSPHDRSKRKAGRVLPDPDSDS